MEKQPKTPPPPEWLERHKAARVSWEAWNDFVTALQAGPEMDCHLFLVLYGPHAVALRYPKIDKYSADGRKMMALAWRENDSVRLRKEWGEVTCDLSYEQYEGSATEKTLPLAICRAMLNMFAPPVQEVELSTPLFVVPERPAGALVFTMKSRY